MTEDQHIKFQELLIRAFRVNMQFFSTTDYAAENFDTMIEWMRQEACGTHGRTVEMPDADTHVVAQIPVKYDNPNKSKMSSRTVAYSNCTFNAAGPKWWLKI